MNPSDKRDQPRPGDRDPGAAPGGLCPQCSHVRKIVSAKGSVFWMCELAKSDERFPRYPPQPRSTCPGFAR